MQKKYNIGILGATGEVGRQMLKVLEEYQFPVGELRLFASKNSIGKSITFQGKEYFVTEAKPESFTRLDFVLGATSNDIARSYKDSIVKAKAIFIDNSSAFRLDKDIPLVIPEINPEDALKNKGVIANPNCSTILALMAIHGIEKLSKIQAMSVTTYQATSGAGALGPQELSEQMAAIVHNQKIEPHIFPYPIALNVIPQIGSFLDNGYTTEEMKMQNEGRKILHREDLNISCTCVRVPVVRSHSIAIELITEEELSIEAVKEAIQGHAGCRLYDDPEQKLYPMPLLTSNQDLVYVGRIRKSLLHSHGIVLWCSGDQVRKGAASNAVQIMMKLIGLEPLGGSIC